MKLGRYNEAQPYGQFFSAYLVRVEELEEHTVESFPEVPVFRRDEKPDAFWIIPIGCDKS